VRDDIRSLVNTDEAITIFPIKAYQPVEVERLRLYVLEIRLTIRSITPEHKLDGKVGDNPAIIESHGPHHKESH